MFLLISEDMPLKYSSWGERKSKRINSGKSWEFKKHWIEEFVNIVQVNFLIGSLGQQIIFSNLLIF